MFRKLQGGAGTPALSWATGQKLKANGTKASKTIQILWRERLTSRYVIKGWRGGTGRDSVPQSPFIQEETEIQTGEAIGSTAHSKPMMKHSNL